MILKGKTDNEILTLVGKLKELSVFKPHIKHLKQIKPGSIIVIDRDGLVIANDRIIQERKELGLLEKLEWKRKFDKICLSNFRREI